MDEGTAQLVMRCSQCNKPFDKASSLKRHGYYCRTRKPGDKPSRVQSCLGCISGKARCDRKRPQCSRCLDKSIDCQYPAKANGPRGNAQERAQRTGESALSRSPDTVSSPETNSPPLITVPREDGMGDNIIVDDNHAAELDTAAGSFQGVGFDWDIPQEAEFLEFITPSAGGNELTQTLSSKNLLPFGVPSTTFQITQPFQLPRAVTSPNRLTIPRSPSNNPRSLIRRPKMKTGAQRIASLICHTLKSYPLMMMRDKALPPFIHPQMVFSEHGARDTESPLHNCISLMHMLHAGLQGNRKLFWRNVRQECERICKSSSGLSYPELIAGLQAASIYIIMRLDDADTEDNDIDGLLIMTVITLSLELDKPDFEQDFALSNMSPESTWRHWMLIESGRRLCTLYQIVNMVVVFEPAAMCELAADGLILSPLPARKQLWEAGTAAQWTAEFKRDPGSPQTDYAMTTQGDLVQVSETPNQVVGHGGRVWSRPKVEWEEWFSRMDSFGGLVMLAASLVGY